MTTSLTRDLGLQEGEAQRRWEGLEPNLQIRNALNHLQSPVLLSRDAPGTSVSLSADVAVARGLLEAGAKVVTSYPGAGVTVDYLAAVAERFGIYVEWSTNEKVAFEVAAAGAMAGIRTCCYIKDLGINVAADTILQFCMGGVEGGMVFLAATSPGAAGTHSEPDVRPYSDMFKFIGLDPADAQEAKDMVIAAFDISERTKLPVLMLDTIRYEGSPVKLGTLPSSKRMPNLIKDRSRWDLFGKALVLPRKHWQLQQLELAQSLIEELPFNKLRMKGNEDLGIITTGTASNLVWEVIEAYALSDVAVLKVASFNPLPEKLVGRLLSQVKKVLVVELFDPYLENKIREFASRTAKPVEVRGKKTNDLPSMGPYTFDMVAKAVGGLRGDSLTLPELEKQELRKRIRDTVPFAAAMCPGCPHRSTFYALKQALRRAGKEYTILTDTGCTMRFSVPPMNMGDIKMNLGSSIGFMSGLRHSGIEDRVIVACLGDSAFYHAGLSPLVNLTMNGVPGMVVVMDNDSNASTGRQPTASTGVTGMGWDTKKINLEALAKACNVDYVRTIDPYPQKEAQDSFYQAITKPEGQKLIVSNRECALQLVTRRRLEGSEAPRYHVKEALCIGCGLCVKDFGCPGIYLQENGKARIDEAVCIGAGACVGVCPTYAIAREQ